MASSEVHGIDPRRLADVTLAAAIRSRADAVFFEPRGEETYTITLERDHQTLASTTIEALLGAATVARFAYLASLDLAAASPTSGIIKVRSGDRTASIVVTIRPGSGLGADLMVMRHDKPRTPAASIEVGVGDVVGNYRIVEPLGAGGMGSVFRVEHVALGRSYALKILHARVFEGDPTAGQRFLREARAAARVRHPNIGDVFDFGHLADGRPFIVMEVLEGESLADRVEREPLPVSEVVAVARQLAGALCAVHDRGVVHGDVTPTNVLITGGDSIHIKLIDFGLAAIADEMSHEQDSKFALGTPSYISPEQLRGLPATDRSDQYGLGAVLFFLLAGHPPYMSSKLRDLCMMHLEAPIPVATSPLGPLPPKLADLITTCLQKSPQQRFPGLRAMLTALDDIERVTERRGWRRWLG